MKRNEGESFEQYKERRAAINEDYKIKSCHYFVHISKTYEQKPDGTFVANKGVTFRKPKEKVE